VTDFEALVAESNPTVPGAHVRLALLRRGAEIERERIVQLLKQEMCKKCKSKPNEAVHIDCEIVSQCLNGVRKWNE
jgi:hypothetical protein